MQVSASRAHPKQVLEPYPEAKNKPFGPKINKRSQQAEAELGQAQPKFAFSWLSHYFSGVGGRVGWWLGKIEVKVHLSPAKLKL